MIFERIKADYLKARKDKNQLETNLLSAFVGEIELMTTGTKQKITEDFVVSRLKKWEETAKANILIFEQRQAERERKIAESEIQVINRYLPNQLSIEEIASILQEKGLTELKTAMPFLKNNYANQYDGAKVAEYLKNIQKS